MDKKHCDVCNDLLPDGYDANEQAKKWATEEGFSLLPMQYRKGEKRQTIFGLISFGQEQIAGEDWKDNENVEMVASPIEICDRCAVRMIGTILDGALKSGLVPLK